MLDNLAHMLKSNEQFEMNDSFQLSFVHVCRAPVGQQERAGDNRNERRQWTKPRQCVCRRDQAARALLGEVGLRPGPYGPDAVGHRPKSVRLQGTVMHLTSRFFGVSSLIACVLLFTDYCRRRQQSLRLLPIRSWGYCSGALARRRALRRPN